MWQPQGFYNQYVLRTPVLLSGHESIRGLYNYPASRIAVIHGESFTYQDEFTAAFSDKDIRFRKRSWKGEPDLDGLKETIGWLEAYNPDLIIAVGGGSVIDGCKICRLFYEVPYYEHGNTRLNGGIFNTGFVAIPTTVGSGAEVSSAAVFLDHENHRKDMIVLHELLPDVVVYDSRYVMNSSDRLLISSALDAMAHILEGYVSNIDNSVMDVAAEEGMVLLRENLKLILRENESPDPGRLQYAGFLGGIVQNHCIVGAAHAVAHQLTDHGYSHSEAVALLLPAVIRMNSSDTKTTEKYGRIAVKSGFDDIDDMTAFIEQLLHFSGIDERREPLADLLRDLMQDEAVRENIKNDRGGKGNPVEITDEYIEQLIGSI